MSGKDLKKGSVIECNGAASGKGWIPYVIEKTDKRNVFVRSKSDDTLTKIRRFCFDRLGWSTYYRIQIAV